MNRDNGCLIEIIKSGYNTNAGRIVWFVKEVCSGFEYGILLPKISNAMNEMEGIAWAAK